jgi:peptide deformylase
MKAATMALREILKFPDPRLKQVSAPIAEITDEFRELASDMIDVMYDEPGIGLAAPQVGESIRLVVVDTEWGEDDAERNPMVVVNPELLEPEGKVTWNEGCLSVPDFNADVERAERVLLRGTDLEGNPIEERLEDLRAVCFQHEIDHLDGVLFIDRISRLKRSMYVKKRKKQLLADEEDEGADRKQL